MKSERGQAYRTIIVFTFAHRMHYMKSNSIAYSTRMDGLNINTLLKSSSIAVRPLIVHISHRITDTPTQMRSNACPEHVNIEFNALCLLCMLDGVYIIQAYLRFPDS